MDNKFKPVSLGYVIWDENEKRAIDWFGSIGDAEVFVEEFCSGEEYFIIECFTHPAGAVIAPKE